MRYLFFFSILFNSCLPADTEANLVLDTGASDIALTITNDLRTAELGSKSEEGVPIKYRLQLHAFINHARPLAKNADGNFLPLIFGYVIFSYWHEQLQQTTTVYTCIEKDVAIGMPHQLDIKHCTAGEDFRQKVLACVADDTKHFKIAEDEQKNLSCASTTDNIEPN